MDDSLGPHIRTSKIEKVELVNWRNFSNVKVHLEMTNYLIGPNAVGKSNFLDAMRFVHDCARDGIGPEANIFAVAADQGIARIVAAEDEFPNTPRGDDDQDQYAVLQNR